MTEYQAWRYLEKKWEKPVEFCGRIVARIGFWYMSGLCHSVSRLLETKRMSRKTFDDMKAKLLKQKRLPTLYSWSRTKRGAKARARFCKRMADKLKPTKKGKRK